VTTYLFYAEKQTPNEELLCQCRTLTCETNRKHDSEKRSSRVLQLHYVLHISRSAKRVTPRLLFTQRSVPHQDGFPREGKRNHTLPWGTTPLRAFKT